MCPSICAGLVLTSELVITACKQQSPSVQVLVRGLLQHEEKNRLVDLRSFEDMPMLRQVFEETKRDCICGRQVCAVPCSAMACSNS